MEARGQTISSCRRIKVTPIKISNILYILKLDYELAKNPGSILKCVGYINCRFLTAMYAKKKIAKNATLKIINE